MNKKPNMLSSYRASGVKPSSTQEGSCSVSSGSIVALSRSCANRSSTKPISRTKVVVWDLRLWGGFTSMVAMQSGLGSAHSRICAPLLKGAVAAKTVMPTAKGCMERAAATCSKNKAPPGPKSPSNSVMSCTTKSSLAGASAAQPNLTWIEWIFLSELNFWNCCLWCLWGLCAPVSLGLRGQTGQM